MRGIGAPGARMNTPSRHEPEFLIEARSVRARTAYRKACRLSAELAGGSDGGSDLSTAQYKLLRELESGRLLSRMVAANRAYGHGYTAVRSRGSSFATPGRDSNPARRRPLRPFGVEPVRAAVCTIRVGWVSGLSRLGPKQLIERSASCCALARPRRLLNELSDVSAVPCVPV